ncbi:MAG: YtxH domain-containing protein [Elusimicrobia bacterium]|jgi:gas vesicle protein|nr:YtxH domain-containing protein [Elusimicrobiota bacterium]
MSENRGSEIIGAFVVGGLIGAILGVLYAPAPGKETREKLNDWMEETKEKTQETIEKLEAEIKKRKEHLMKHVN